MNMHEYARIGFMTLGSAATVNPPVRMATEGKENLRLMIDINASNIGSAPLKLNLNVNNTLIISYLFGSVGARTLVCSIKNVMVVNPCIFTT